MKKYIYIIGTFIFLLMACQDDFLEKVPKTSLSPEGFFRTPEDLETYTNSFYDYFGSYGTRDNSTDDQTKHSESDHIKTLLTGNLSPANVGGWGGWATLRNINYFLENYTRVEADEAELNHYAGFARLMRANWYISKILDYGKAPWIDQTLNVTDTTLLYKGHDSREFVVGKIMEDLDFAVNNIKSEREGRTKVNKDVALAVMARFCLAEASWRKYHTYLGLNDANSFYEKAANAAQQIMETGEYEIWNNGNVNTSYNEFFRQESLSGNKEAVLFIEYSYEDPVREHSTFVHNYWGLSKSLVDSYLMQDGTRFTELPGADTISYKGVFVNRDPRLKQTVMHPGWQWPNESEDYTDIRVVHGGYTQQKFIHHDKVHTQWDNANDLCAYRYAEILLIYAEAKAELGTLTQEDLNQSINKIRERVGMPGLDLAEANADVDPVQEGYYPNVTGSNKGVILEIRRERRVEFACEGMRTGDMFRWHCGQTFAARQYGMYVPEFGAYDITGDGIDDIAILDSDESLIADHPNKESLAVYKVSDGQFTLSNGSSGYMQMTSDDNIPKSFVQPRYYYTPIPQSVIVQVPNLTQPIGWE